MLGYSKKMPSASLQQAAAQALAAVQRAQALFGPHAHAPAASEPSLGSAVPPLAGAGQRALDDFMVCSEGFANRTVSKEVGEPPWVGEG
jgi:hypothetical protein